MTGNRMKAVLLHLGLIIGLLLNMGIDVQAEETTVQLGVADTELMVGDVTDLTITIENLDTISELTVEGLDSFDIISSSQMNSTQVVNGNITSQIGYTYIISPKEEGTFELIASVEAKGTVYTSNSITINVTELSGEGEAEIILDDLFIETELSKENAYLGEKIILTYKLYSKSTSLGYYFERLIVLDGFVKTEVNEDLIYLGSERIQGENYHVYEIRKMLLSPTKTGTISIPSFVVEVETSDDSWGFSDYIMVDTEGKNVEILPLPKTDQPKEFSGLVGQLDIEATYSEDELEYGESLTLNLRLSGSANIELFDPENFPIPDGMNSYMNEKELVQQVEGNSYYEEKEIEIILIPQITGELELEPYVVNYFNVEEQQYEEIIIPGNKIIVTGELKEDSSGSRKEEPVTKRIEISQIHVNDKEDDYFQIPKTVVVILLIVVTVAIIVILIIFFVKRRAVMVEENLNSIHKRAKVAKDDIEYYNVLNDLIKYCFQFSLKASSKAEITQRISNEAVRSEVIKVVDYIESDYAAEKLNLKRSVKTVYKMLRRMD